MKKKAGTIPIRIMDGALMVCLVSSRKRKKKLVLPKGVVSPKEKHRQTALRETLEEAGLKGLLSKSSIKVETVSADDETHYSIKYFAMMVEDELDSWAEKKTRRRRWVDLHALPEHKMVSRDLEILKSPQFQIMVKELVF